MGTQSPVPCLGAVEVLAPRHPWPGARVSGAMLMADTLVFRAEGSIPPGLYSQDVHGDGPPRMLLPDEPTALHLNPVAAGNLLAVHRVAVGRIPPTVDAVVFVHQGTTVLNVPGQSVGISGDGRVAVVADVKGKVLHHVDLGARTSEQAATMDGGMHLHLAPVISVDMHGTRALFMDARKETCDGSLELVDLERGNKTRLLGPLPAPGRVCAQFAPEGNGMVAVEMCMADGPSFRLRWMRGDGMNTQVLQLPLAMPLTAPVFVSPETVVLPMTLSAFPGASHGPVELVVVHLPSASTQPLTRSGTINCRVRLHGNTVLAEGGPVVLRLPLAE